MMTRQGEEVKVQANWVAAICRARCLSLKRRRGGNGWATAEVPRHSSLIRKGKKDRAGRARPGGKGCWRGDVSAEEDLWRWAMTLINGDGTFHFQTQSSNFLFDY